MACSITGEGCKGLGRSVTGYWGRSVYKRLAEEQEYNRQVALLQDQIEGSSIRADLWVGVKSGNKCNCYKESNRSSDRKCKTCYGNMEGFVPGYLKFGYETLWMSVEDSDIVLTNCEIVTDFKSSKAGLISGVLTGTIESSNKIFSRTAIGSVWESEAVQFIRIADQSNVVVEYSLDSGLIWKPISDLSTENPSTGVIRFRATLTRDSINVLTPFFEIVRARFSRIDYRDLRSDGSYSFGPFIKIMSSKPYNNILKSEYGDIPNTSGINFWTVGLSYFDPSIVRGTPDELLDSSYVVIKFLEGVLKNKVFVIMNWQLSDPGGYVIVTQSFNIREEDSVGPKSLIW